MVILKDEIIDSSISFINFRPENVKMSQDSPDFLTNINSFVTFVLK